VGRRQAGARRTFESEPGARRQHESRAYGEPCTADEDALLASLLSPTGLRAIVAAAGNNAADANGNFPSSCASTIAVTATSNTGDRTFYSNYGTSVDLAAPGGDRGGLNGLIYVLSNFGTTSAGAYAIAAGGGTSYAAPMVSGRRQPDAGGRAEPHAAQVRTILTTKYKPFPAESRCTQTTCGKGIVDARAAVIAAQATLPPRPRCRRRVLPRRLRPLFHDRRSRRDRRVGRWRIRRRLRAHGPAVQRVERAVRGHAAGMPLLHRRLRAEELALLHGRRHRVRRPQAEPELAVREDRVPRARAGRRRVRGRHGPRLPDVQRRADRCAEPPVHDRRALYQQFTTTMGWSAEGVALCATP
jgi:hypothetical protein